MCFTATACINNVDQIDEIVSWLKQAGQISLNYFRKVETQIKADQTLLTAADLEIEDFLSTKLRSAFPHQNLIGEEGVGNVTKKRSSAVWVIDPLDGTTVFSLGLPGWGISVGLLCEGFPKLGFFYMPLTGELTYAVNPEEIYFDGLRLQDSVCTQWAPKRFLAINATAHADFAIQIRNTRALGSIGANLASTARGIAIATFAAKARIWDLVAGAAIIHSAGGALCYLDGQPIDYLALLDGRVTPQPIIAAHPHLVSSITSRISPQPVY